MQKNSYTSFKKVTKEDLYQITLKSSNAKSKEIFIFEKDNMSELFGEEKSEQIRQNFLKNKVRVNQITNMKNLPKFTKNDEFVNKLLIFRYVPEEIYKIDHEILIFDNIVAIYNLDEILIIENEKLSFSYKQFFLNIWDLGIQPKLNFNYKPNHSFYNDITFNINSIQVIVWPDVDAKESYKNITKKDLENYLRKIIESDSYFKDSSYIIAFIWSFNGEKMVDIWKFTQNHVDDRSGPLGDVRVYREGQISKDLGLASGNTLLVLASEEKLRRQSKDLKDYLKGSSPKLPLELLNGKDFFNQ